MKLYKIKKSNIDKKGLYASKDIKSGARIINYKGKLITNTEVEQNPKFDNDKDIYLFDINKRYSLDGDFSWNTARLINHSCNPNCEVDGKGYKIWITAIKDIKKMKNSHMIMDSVMTKIINSFHVSVAQKIAVDI